MTLKLTALSALLSSASATTCQSLCDTVVSCASDPGARGSYCKEGESPQNCFGLFFTNESLETMCFQPNDDICPETFPVQCPVSSAEIVSESFPSSTSILKPESTCQEICDQVESCREDPQAHGSYCKFEETTPVCFGTF